jgi:uncharacterized protein YhaN
MRIESLRVARYGHFRDHSLELPSEPGAQGFHLILGANEAGKSTLLSALHALLFGFPERTPYNFLYSYNEFAVSAELCLGDGERARVVRRKARVDSLSGERAGGLTADHTWLAARLGTTREVYEHLYGFSLTELETGAALLADGTMREALFGAGLGGGARVQEVLAGLRTQADDLYKPSGKKQDVALALKRLGELGVELRAALLKPDDYRRKQDELRDADAEAAGAAAERTRLREEERRCARLAQALPLRRQADLLDQQADGLRARIPADFPRDGSTRYEALRADLTRITAEVAKSEGRVTELEAQLAGIAVDRELLARRVEVNGLVAELGRAKDARRDAPKREADLRKLRDEVTSRLASLRPGWDVARLAGFAVDHATTDRLRELVVREKTLHDERVRLDQSTGDRRQRIERERRDLAALGDAEDVTALADLVDEWPRREAEAARLETEARELADRHREETEARALLDPPLPPGAEDAPTFALPSLERVRADEAAFRACDERETKLRAEAEAQTARRLQYESELRTQHREDLPSREQLTTLRESRDALWAAIREHGPTSPADAAYEQAVTEADAYADALFEHAEAVTRRETCERQLADATHLEREARAHLDGLATERAALQSRWEALFAPCDVVPHQPAAMFSWLNETRAYLALRRDGDAREARLQEAREALDDYERRLRTAVGDEAAPLSRLAKQAAKRVESARATEAERVRLGTSVGRLLSELAAEDEALAALVTREAAFDADRRACLSDLGLEPNLRTETVQEIVAGLTTERERWNVGAPDLERRVELMRATVASFDRDAAALCQAVAPDLDATDPTTAVGKLQERLEAATRAEALEAETARTLEQARREREQRSREREAREHDIAELLRLGGVIDDDGIREMGLRIAELTRLEQGALEVRGRLDVITSQTDPRTFGAELDAALDEGADAEQLALRASDLENAARDAEARLSEAHQLVGRLQGELRAFDGASRAAELQAEMESERAKLRHAAERYAVATIAADLLEREMERFQRENQPRVVERAAALFAAMTGGRYASLRLAPGPAGEVLAVPPEGDPLSFAQLSTGTGQQLYLALRLAYIDCAAEARETLPLVMDDVLVNFDDDRARSTLRALTEFSSRHQVLFLTCHRHLVELAREVTPGVAVTVLEGAG